MVVMRPRRALVIVIVGVPTWLPTVMMVGKLALCRASLVVIQAGREGTQPDRGKNADDQEP